MPNKRRLKQLAVKLFVMLPLQLWVQRQLLGALLLLVHGMSCQPQVATCCCSRPRLGQQQHDVLFCW
jgi:hypothetical protein